MPHDSSGTRRRQFIKGITASGTVLLAGCSGDGQNTEGGDGGSGDGDGGGNDTTGDDGGAGDTGGNQEETEISFVHISSFENDMGSLGPMFDEANDSVSIDATATPAASSTTREYYVNQFISQSTDFDIGMMDVIWPAEFVGNEWAAEVSDPEGHTDEMLDTPVEAATIDDTLYGMPMFTDANAFYYREDKLEEYGHDVPETYMEVVDVAQDVLEQDDEIDNGYIWQGGSNEGLTIMWLNWLWGMGGTVHHDDQLKVDTQKGIDALGHAVDLIHEHEVTPESIPASGTDGNRQTFQQGGTLFMRNWPYAVAVMSEEGSAVKDKFSVATMPKAEGNPDAPNSCLGGWSIFINRFSENKDAAQQFAQFVATKEAQEALALEHSRLPVRKDLYTEEYFEQAPLLETFAEALEQTSARPATPKYATFSEIVYTECNKALVQDKSPEQALTDAQNRIDQQINNA